MILWLGCGLIRNWVSFKIVYFSFFLFHTENLNILYLLERYYVKGNIFFIEYVIIFRIVFIVLKKGRPLNSNQRESQRFSEKFVVFNQYSTIEKNHWCYTEGDLVNFHWISDSTWFIFRVRSYSKAGFHFSRQIASGWGKPSNPRKP